MKAISIRQPWAWLIIRPDLISPAARAAAMASTEVQIKDIENRNWKTKHRGRVLVHAAKGMTREEYNYVKHFLSPTSIILPSFSDFDRGGIIGSVEIVDCVNDSNSVWFTGRYGFVLKDPKPLPFIPWKGQLGFFEVPDSAVEEAIKRESETFYIPRFLRRGND